MPGNIVQINIKPKTDKEVGLPKKPVNSTYVSMMNVGEDFNRYRMTLEQEKIANRAILIYPLELIEQLNSEGWPIKPGDLGENITTKGIKYKDFSKGKKFQFGNDLKIEITDMANPCSGLRVLPYVGESKLDQFKKILMGRRGMYAKVISEGEIKINDKIKELP